MMIISVHLHSPSAMSANFALDLAAEDIDLSAVIPEMQSGFYR